MGSKKAPYIFLLILSFILILVIGVQLGKQVEQTNKTINYLLSITPSPIRPTPTSLPENYYTYVQKTCGIQFLYPSSLEKAKEKTTSVEFTSNKQLAIAIDCGKEKISFDFAQDKSLDQNKIATEEIKFKNQPLKITAATLENNNKLYFFQINNSRNGKTIFIRILDNLYPLFEKTVEFVP